MQIRHINTISNRMKRKNKIHRKATDRGINPHATTTRMPRKCFDNYATIIAFSKSVVTL